METNYNSVIVEKIKLEVAACSTHSKEKSKNHGQVFTPVNLINAMVDGIPLSSFHNPTKTFLDPCAGNGNFPAVLVVRLMQGLSLHFKDENERYKHIMEKQIFMGELLVENAKNIERIFNPNGDLKLNLFVGDCLGPDFRNFFGWPYEIRLMKYPKNCIRWILDNELKHDNHPVI